MNSLRQHLANALPPQAVALRERLADPDWHPSEQEQADAEHALARPHCPRQPSLPLAA
jgi:hypothetical protein